MKNVWIVGLALAVPFCGAIAAGLDAKWVPTAQGSHNFATLANWTDESGAAVTRAPTNAADTLRFDAVTPEGEQLIYFPTDSAYHQIGLGTLFGTTNQTLRQANRTTNMSALNNYSLLNPNGFLGTFSQYDDHATWTVSSDSGFTPRLAALNTSRWTTLADAGDGTTAVGKAVGGGTLEKKGSGTLKLEDVESTQENDRASVRVTEGTVSLDMDEKFPDDLAPAPGAYIRLDASRQDTMTLVEKDGRTCISEWRDADGRDIKATQYGDFNLPWLSTVDSVNGCPLVDFGAHRNSSENPNYESYWAPKLGPAASLAFPQTKNASEVFAVFEDTQNSNTCAFVLGDKNTYHFHRNGSDTLLSESYYKDVHANDITYIDGVRRCWSYRPYDFHRLCVVSVHATGGWLSTLANDRNGIRAGGCRIAEVIIYEKDLTDRERFDTHRYLQAKWTVGRRVTKAKVATLRMADGTAVDVPAGKRAVVTALDVPAGKTVTKTGAGALNVTCLPRKGFSVNVQGGEVSFRDTIGAIADDAPASEPQLWLDATKADSFVRSGGSGHDCISRWNDCRAEKTGVAAYHDDANCPTYPWLAPSVAAAGGLSVVDFGGGFTTDWGGNYTWAHFKDAAYADPTIRRESSYLKLSGVSDSYAGFVVMRMKMKNGAGMDGACKTLNPPMFSSSGQDFTRWNTGNVLSRYGAIGPRSAFWTIDGIPCQSDGYYDFGTNDFHVIAFSAEVAANVNQIANDRNIALGGVEIGEILLYRRTLHDFERRQTEAYLLRKWKNASHPETTDLSLASLAFGAGVEPKVVTDRALAVGAITTEDGTSFAKSGAGALTVSTPLPATVTDYDISGACTVATPLSAFPDAALHCDAARADTFTFRAGQEADRRIDRWYDCRGNGRYAQCDLNQGRTNAVLAVTGDAGAGGVLPNMPYVDFGTDAGMIWHKADGTQLQPEDTREWHVVFMVTSGGGNFQPIGGYRGQYELAAIFPSGNLSKPFWDSDEKSCCYAKAALKKTDGGDWYAGNKWFPGGASLSTSAFYVHSLAATNGVCAYSFAIDRGNCGYGHVKLCEAIVFTGKTNTIARANAIHAYLLNKWKGIGANPVSIGLGSVKVAAGGSLSLKADVPVSVARVTGGGTLDLNGPSVRDLARIDVSADADGALSAVTVSAPVTFADVGTVTLSVPAGLRLARGSYPIFTATSVSNFDRAKWTLVHEPMRGRALRLRASATAVFLDVEGAGGAFIVR